MTGSGGAFASSGGGGVLGGSRDVAIEGMPMTSRLRRLLARSALARDVWRDVSAD